MRVFLTFLAAYVLSQFYRSFLAVIAPELALEMHLGPQALGNMQAYWIWGFVAMQFPVGWALDTLGPRRTVASLMAFAVAGAILFAQADSAAALNAAMVLIGIGCGSVYMGAIYVFGRVHRPDQFALLCSWLLGIGSAGNLLAAAPLAWAAQTIGWRNAMFAIALATGVSAVTIALLLRDPPRVEHHDKAGFLHGIIAILSIRGLWPLLPITAIGYSTVLSERGLWAGPFLSDVFGLEPVARGNALLAMAAAMSFGAMVYGPLDRVLGTRKWIVVAGTMATAACFIALATLDLALIPAVGMMAALGAFGMTYGVLMAHGRGFVPDHLLGRGITLLNVLFLGGAGLMQPLSGAMMARLAGKPATEAYADLHLFYGILLLIALVIYLAARDMRPRR
ncbi:MAG: MFS transporter [Alphaproteobacteria bacterium]|nr:MFS transporter [Alphaproteobacteria bacterium]